MQTKTNEQPEPAYGKIPIELYHLFMGKPQCVMLDDIYISDRHLHKEIEVVYILSGELEIIVGEQQFKIGEGSMLFIPANAMHQYMNKKCPGDIVKIKFIKQWLIPSFFQSDQKKEYNTLFSQAFLTRPDKQIDEIVRSMLDNKFPAYREFFLLGKLVEMAAYLLQKPEVIEESSRLGYEDYRYIEDALVYMQDHCFSKLTLKMLADHLGLTESYCSRYISSNTGMTFVECLNAIRVNNAQRLLIYTHYNMTEIMEQTGFSSIQSFNRVFKAQMGQSPTMYRKQKKGSILRTEKRENNRGNAG
ncbi:MAG TPA: AraC family transcriptional regulator [Candidatus Limiplasma sp.]|nr:AraC family transcriptional regulator [Candidatus Limiplasma sp.]